MSEVNCECHINKSLCALHGGAQITEAQRELAEKMYEAFDDMGGTGNYIRAMLAALAVARAHRKGEQ